MYTIGFNVNFNRMSQINDYHRLGVKNVGKIQFICSSPYAKKLINSYVFSNAENNGEIKFWGSDLLLKLS